MPDHHRSNSDANGHELDALASSDSHDGKDGAIAKETPRAPLLAWKRELAMLLLSLAAILALVIVLAVEDGKEYRRWGPLTLNAVNAILTTAAGSSLTAFVGSALSQNMWNVFAQARRPGSNAFVTRPARDLQAFESASRGPMGSILLLASRRSGAVAALGALATVLNLAFATFTQQLITTEVRSVQVGAARPFATSQRYNVDTPPGVELGVQEQLLNFSTIAAIVGAGLQGNNALPFAPDCPTGNCTYPKSVPTLAMCGSCTDVTRQLDHHDNCAWKLPPCNESNTADCGAMGSPCNYNLPNGPRLSFQPGYSSNGTGGLYAIWNATNLLGTTDASGFTEQPSLPSLAYNDEWKVYAMKIAMIGLAPGVAAPFISQVAAQPDGAQEGTLPPMAAHECALWFCLNFYDIAVNNGTVKTELTSSYTKLGSSSSVDANGLSFLDDAGNSVTAQPYGLQGPAADAVANTISTFVPLGNSHVMPDWLVPNQYIFGESSTYLNLVQGLYRNSDNLANWTTNLAQALTNEFAAVAPAPATDEYDGVALQAQTYFKMRWYWLTLPLLVFCLACSFLFATIAQTRRRLVQPWQDNALALVVAGLDEETRQHMERIDNASQSGQAKSAPRTGGDVLIGLRKRAGGTGMVFASDPLP